MVKRQELHWVGEERLARAVTARPDSVWEIRGTEAERPSLPYQPVHARNAWLMDIGHDWSMRGPGGCLRYSPGGGHKGAWLLCEWETRANKRTAGARCTVAVDENDRECGLPVPCPDHGEAAAEMPEPPEVTLARIALEVDTRMLPPAKWKALREAAEAVLAKARRA